MTTTLTHTLPSASGRQQNKAHRCLNDAVIGHAEREVASFHMPGHKQRASDVNLSAYSFDVTELPGLDDLTRPNGVLLQLEQRAAKIWGAEHSLLSVNGSSASIVAAMLACSPRGSKILVPRNAHRSVIHGLVISGLEPIWYEPEWDGALGVWGATAADAFEEVLSECDGDLAAALVVSPTYAGQRSDIRALADVAHARRGAPLALIVDEAQGAHLPQHAARCGADLVIHSLHKTLPGLTQTGLIHVSKQSLIDVEQVRSMLTLMHTSSPSYLLMSSIEKALDLLETRTLTQVYSEFQRLHDDLAARVKHLSDITVNAITERSDAAHILVSHKQLPPTELHDYLFDAGICPEAVLGNSVLLLLGTGSTTGDIIAAAAALEQLEGKTPTSASFQNAGKPAFPPQVMSPRQAYLAPTELVATEFASGRIAADCYAPCPPGTPLVVPGQRLASCNFGENMTRIRVVVESYPRRS